MPFDQTAAQVASTTEPLLSPAVADLPPLERLERLRRWLLSPDAEKDWDYRIVGDGREARATCRTIGCAAGQYMVRTGRFRPGNTALSDWGQTEFGASYFEIGAVFLYADQITRSGSKSAVTPADVATVIGMVQRGEL